VAVLCRCGEPVARAGGDGKLPDIDDVACSVCGLRYAIMGGVVSELTPPS
jgi:hypothetical protein